MLASSLSVCNFACVVFVSSVLVSLDGVLHIVLLSVLLFRHVFVRAIVLLCFGFGLGNIWLQVGSLRFPGEVGELTPLGGVPYLR